MQYRMSSFQIFALIGCGLIGLANCKVYTRCQLAEELVHNYGVSRDEVANWVCLAEHESNFNTQAVGNGNSDGSQDLGIFQINSRWWCSGGAESNSNGCGISCSLLTNDDISDDVTCAKTIKQQSGGFSAWVAWRNYCQGDISSYVSSCNI